MLSENKVLVITVEWRFSLGTESISSQNNRRWGEWQTWNKPAWHQNTPWFRFNLSSSKIQVSDEDTGGCNYPVKHFRWSWISGLWREFSIIRQAKVPDDNSCGTFFMVAFEMTSGYLVLGNFKQYWKVTNWKAPEFFWILHLIEFYPALSQSVTERWCVFYSFCEVLSSRNNRKCKEPPRWALCRHIIKSSLRFLIYVHF